MGCGLGSLRTYMARGTWGLGHLLVLFIDAMKEVMQRLMITIRVSFTPDNRYLLTSGLDSVPKMWDLKTFANLRTYTGCDPSVYFFFSPLDRPHVSSWHQNTRVDMMGKDASFVIGRGAATDEIAIWSANHGGPPVTTLAQAHTDTILGVVSTPQQRSFVSLSADLRAKVWTEVLSPSQ